MEGKKHGTSFPEGIGVSNRDVNGFSIEFLAISSGGSLIGLIRFL